MKRIAVAMSTVVAGLLLSNCGPNGATPLSPTSPNLAVTVQGVVFDSTGQGVGDVSVTASARTQAITTTTAAAGTFSVGPFDVAPADKIDVSFRKPGYLSRTINVRVTDAQRSYDVLLPPVVDLPIDGAATASLLVSDPAAWVNEDGEDYEGDVSWNTRYFAFTIPPADDLDVVLAWEDVGNAALTMWALNGTIRSQPSGVGQALRLPRGSTGVLLVGQPYEAGQLTQAVPFTLTSRTARSQ